MPAGNSHRLNMTVVIAFILVTVLALIPAFINFIISLIDFTPAKGIFGSPFAGLTHFKTVLSANFARLLGNSFSLWLSGFLAALIPGLVVSLLCSMIRDRRIAATCTGLLLIPAFLPAVCYFILVCEIFSTNVFIDNKSYIFGLIAQTICPNAALIAFSGSAFGLIWRAQGRNPFTGALTGALSAGLLFCFTGLSPAFEAVQLSYNPLVYESADTLDTFTYRSGLVQMQFGPSAAAYVLRSGIQLMIAIIPALILAVWLRKQDRLPHAILAEGSANSSPKSWQAWIPWVSAVLVILAAALAAGIPGSMGNISLNKNLLASIPTVLIALVLGAAMSMLILSMSPSIGRVGIVILAGLLLVPANALIGQFLLARQLGLINTVLPTGLFAWLLPQALLLIFIFALILHDFSPKAVMFFRLSAACLIGTLAYGSVFPNMLFFSRQDLRSPAILLHDIFIAPTAYNQHALALVYLIIALPSLMIGLAGAALAKRGLLDIVQSPYKTQ